MTHEYNIGLGGRIEASAKTGSEAATAIAWAADGILAVGPDEVVRAISRGDSTFFDLAGAIVTALPTDPSQAETVLVNATSTQLEHGISTLLVDAGLITSDVTLEPGSTADLAFWQGPPATGEGPPGLHLTAIVRAGVFSRGHPRRGPFAAPDR